MGPVPTGSGRTPGVIGVDTLPMEHPEMTLARFTDGNSTPAPVHDTGPGVPAPSRSSRGDDGRPDGSGTTEGRDRRGTLRLGRKSRGPRAVPEGKDHGREPRVECPLRVLSSPSSLPCRPRLAAVGRRPLRALSPRPAVPTLGTDRPRRGQVSGLRRAAGTHTAPTDTDRGDGGKVRGVE